ncbi:hypothetical protein [Streptomyces sp. TLI_146]|uniref:hypothetical protein n=1 Tax=Streptomyces sp. TLI_146 TaxID=1938858 RepID=UPI000C7019BE|nr:hypothetical protein [Streptomyces sp. TLI_146]PKV89910.1 hypothetical protein BX283_7557 [Streptomyces sp. TLI_146]
MSLLVHVFVDGADGARYFLDAPDGVSDTAGFERWRTSVWGSPMVCSLGAQFFPRLADGDLYVEADEVGAFLDECALLASHVALIVTGMDPSRSPEEHTHHLASKLANISHATRRAVEAGGGVVIW